MSAPTATLTTLYDNGAPEEPGTLRVALDGDGVATLTLDRPPLNILSLQLLADLGSAVGALEERAGAGQEPPLRLVVVRSGLDKAFSAGVSIEDHAPDTVGEMLERFHGACRRLAALPVLVVAAVRGHCLGGGLELAASCDLILAEDGARFGQPEVALGCYPPLAAALYPRILGPRRTLELLATGRTFGAEEAERWGLVSWRAEPGRLEERLAEVRASLLGQSAAVLALIKRSVALGAERPFEEALAETERLYTEDLSATADMEEGLTAFLDKRPPRWRHR